ncbi:MAG TPA: hypothetical protein VJ873_03740 [bacterium]|nr:hypothetical protein [bacterium]
MRAKSLPLTWMGLILALGFSTMALAEDDNRMIGKFDQTGPHDSLTSASIYLSFKDDKAEGLPGLASGDETRFYEKVWDGLYLQVTTESGENGTEGYMFGFSSDEDGKELIKPKENPDDPTLQELAATDFRTDDNFSAKPLRGGPGTPEDRGAYRIIHYPGFDAEIRVLEFNIGNAELKKKPYFKSVSCIVTVKEVKEGKKSKGK